MKWSDQPAGHVTTRGSGDRRSTSRFPIEREVRYKILNRKGDMETGGGKTINMSSGGLLFSSDRILLPGRRVEVSVAWPAQLNNSCPLKLVARGRVVRCDGEAAALEIQHYEFRTQGSLGLMAAGR